MDWLMIRQQHRIIRLGWTIVWEEVEINHTKGAIHQMAEMIHQVKRTMDQVFCPMNQVR